MNGYYDFDQRLFPPSNVMLNMSDSDFGSSDSSSLGLSHSHSHPYPSHHHEVSSHLFNNGAISNNTNHTSTNIVQNEGGLSLQQHCQLPMPRNPSGGKPIAMKQAFEHGNSMNADRNDTDHFLNEFQAQMSQMQFAMNAVQKKILCSNASHPPHVGGGFGIGSGKPRAAAVLGMGMKRGPGRPRGSGTGCSSSQFQISGLNGLKIKIKKSPRQLKRKGSKMGKGRKRRKKGEDEDDEDEISEEEERKQANNSSNILGSKSTKTVASASLTEVDHANESPSGWGDKLPENVLAKILSYAVKYEEGCIPVLIRASKVSRLWWKVASKPEIWTMVDLSSQRVKDKFKIERNLVYFLEHRFPFVRNLNLGGWSSALTNASIEVLIRSCTELESLGLNGCQKLTAHHLRTITESCISLKKLDLSAVSTTYNTKTAVSPAAIGETAEIMGDRLTHISLANNCLANCSQIIASLAEYCPNLQALDLSNITSPRRDSIAINIEQLQQGCQKLKILRLTSSDFVLSETSLKEQACSPGVPNLEELSLAVDPKKCQGMDEGDLERILKNCNKLRLLDLRGCSRIGDSGLVRISAWDLEHLYLSGCYATKSSNDGLELVLRKWRHSFKEIDFSWTPGEEAINFAMRALAEDDEIIPPLRILDLCGSSVSFESVRLVLRTCIRLERLNLTSCRALPRGIKRNYQGIEEVITLREQVLRGKFDDHSD